MPETALQRYGAQTCKDRGRHYLSRAVPGATVDHD